MGLVKALALLAVAGGALLGVALTAKSADTGVPAFTYDGSWPKLPLPNKWTFEGITGLVVDKNDVIWVLNRPGDYDNDPIFRRPEVTENYASLNPATALCCLKPEGILAFDQQGNLLKHWNQADKIDGHLILADKAGNIWVGSDTMRKYNQDGKLLGAIERVPAGNPKVGDFPPQTPMFVGRVEGGEFDEDARELFVTDGYMRGRVLVFDMDTMKFKRGWGAYGKPLSEIQFDPKAKYVQNGPPPKDFLGHITLTVSKDGFVYAADRNADRIQVYTKAGKFLREYTVAPETLDRGSTGGMALSPDQKFIYVSDIMNNVVWIVDRMTDKTVGHFGFFGHSGGGFHWIHMVATDSKGNVYTGEVDTGKRVQRFLVNK
jgi:sugar lactone lactonase YvrE